MVLSVGAKLKPNFRKVKLLVQNKGRVWVFLESAELEMGPRFRKMGAANCMPI